jgi:serine/threonine protein kinase
MKLEGVYETDNSIYVILEYLEGMQLNELLKVLFLRFRVEEKSSTTKPSPSFSTSSED